MKLGFTFAAALAATPALAQDDTGQQGQQQPGFPSEQACQAVSERVQLSLSRADQALQGDDAATVAQWSATAANYSSVYATFCGNGQASQQ